MKAFENNILRIYGDKGKAWLAGLPLYVQKIADLWELDHLSPFQNLSYNYVLEGYQKDTPIVLKISLDELSLHNEFQALTAFKYYGAVAVLAHTKDALLLQRAIPGHLLKTQFSSGRSQALTIACDVAKRLHQAPLLKDKDFPHIKDWMRALDKEWDLPRFHLEKARTLKNTLLEMQDDLVLLHGDLHPGNILANGDDWLVIDPKGVIGSPINEIGAFVENPLSDLKFISDYFHFNYDKTLQWYYVHVILAACWKVEDNLDPAFFLNLAKSLVPLIK